MQVSIANDGRFASGHAFITVQDCPPPGDTPWFYLRRASDRMYLSANARWLNTLERIPVCGGLYRDSTYYIPIGPEILSELDSLENHVFSLNGLDPVALEIPPVLPTGLFPDTTGAVGAVLSPSATRLQPTPAPEPEPEPEPAPEPEPEPAPEPVAQAAPLSMGTAEVTKQGTGKGLVIAIVILVLLALGAALYFFVLRDKGEEPAPQPAASEPAQEKPHEPKPLQSEPKPQDAPKPEQASEAAAPTPFLSTARQHLQGNADPAQSLSLAKPMRTMEADANTSDGAFLLIEDAAQKGNAEAMFLLAQYYDPASTLPRGSIQPDVSQAVQWYRQAAQNGIAKADAALKTLRVQVEQKAASGDAEAKRLLQNF